MTNISTIPEPVPTPTPMTMDEALEWLRLAVDTQGRDFVYNPPGGSFRCFYLPQKYAPKGSPQTRTGCLIGTAMKLAGRAITEDMERNNVLSLADQWNLSEHAALILQRAQQVQDSGSTWGEAWKKAHRRAGEILSWNL